MHKMMNISMEDFRIWDKDAFGVFSHNLSLLLQSQDTILTLRTGKPPYRAVLGVPHQAPIGQERIAESTDLGRKAPGRPSDENAASYALVAFDAMRDRQIPCKLVIACHFTSHDPNKVLDSPYCQEIFAETSQLLVECHGAGNSSPHDIEMSSGINRQLKAADYGSRLASRLDYRYSVAAQVAGGTSRAKAFLRDQEEEVKLRLPALKTTSLKAADSRGIPALHLEAKPRFRIRKGDPNSVSDDGKNLGKALASIIIEMASAP